MSVVSYHQCDICGEKGEDPPWGLPDGWWNVSLRNGTKSHNFHVCEDCQKSLLRILNV